MPDPLPPVPSTTWPPDWEAWLLRVGDERIARELRDGVLSPGQLRGMAPATVHGMVLRSAALGPRSAAALVAIYANDPRDPRGVARMVAERERRLDAATRAVLQPHIDSLVERLDPPVDRRGRGQAFADHLAHGIPQQIHAGLLTGAEPGLRCDLRATLAALGEVEPRERFRLGERLAVHAQCAEIDAADRAALVAVATTSLVQPQGPTALVGIHAAMILTSARPWPEMTPEAAIVALGSQDLDNFAALYFAAERRLASVPSVQRALWARLARMGGHLAAEGVTALVRTLDPAPGGETAALVAGIPEALLAQPLVVDPLAHALGVERLRGLDAAVKVRLLQHPDRETRARLIALVGGAGATRDATSVPARGR